VLLSIFILRNIRLLSFAFSTFTTQLAKTAEIFLDRFTQCKIIYLKVPNLFLEISMISCIISCGLTWPLKLFGFHNLRTSSIKLWVNLFDWCSCLEYIQNYLIGSILLSNYKITEIESVFLRLLRPIKPGMKVVPSSAMQVSGIWSENEGFRLS